MRAHLAGHDSLQNVIIPPLVLPGDTLPSGPSNSIVVDSGELHITSTLEMLPGAYIWVNPGATLRVSAKITGACGQMWRGVIVQGDDKPQLPVYQGRVIVDNNGIIEHAVCGIEAGAVGGNGAPFTGPGGGIVNVIGGTFNNNVISITFLRRAMNRDARLLPTLSNMKFISFLLLLPFCLPASGQPFNSAIDLGYPLNHFRDMIVDNDTIIGYGLGFSNDSIPQQGLLLSKFDSSGHHLFSRMILDPGGEPLFIDYHWGKIIKTRDGGYIMTAAPTHSDAAWLIKVDHHFEVEFIKEYLDTVNRSHYRYNVPIELSDGYLLSGSIQRPNYLNNPFVRRVDQQGNTVWFNYYGDYETKAVFNDMAKVNDTLFVAFSTTEVTGNPDLIASAIKYIDWNGNVVRSWQSEPDPEIGFARKILPTSGGGLITFGEYPVEWIGETLIVQPTLAKLDSNFQIEWLRHFGLKARLGADVIFWDIELLSDGHYIGAGESFVQASNSSARRVGWLHKFSPQGDSLWDNFVNAPFPLSEFNRGTLAGVGELSSGSIVAAGEAIEFNKKYIWLVKVTPDGCLDTLCSLVSVAEEEILPAGEAAFSLYPNPTTGQLTLAWEGRLPGQQAAIRLFDATGRVVWRQQRRLERRMELSLAGLPAGLYVLQVQAGEGSWVKRVVVRRE